MVLRKPRGLRHSLPGILAIAACAVIAGARSFVARGIHPDLVPRLFTPFDRLGAETTGIEGTGVGLALAHRLMSKMGESDRSLRNRCRQHLHRLDTHRCPRHRQNPPCSPIQPALGANQRHPATSSAFLFNHRSILCCMSRITELITRLVGRRSAWQMTVANSGATGLDIAAATAPNLVLLDLHLPDMDGIDVLRQLRANTKTESIPIVMLSAVTSSKQINQLLDAGAQTYLTKPLA